VRREKFIFEPHEIASRVSADLSRILRYSRRYKHEKHIFLNWVFRYVLHDVFTIDDHTDVVPDHRYLIADRGTSRRREDTHVHNKLIR